MWQCSPLARSYPPTPGQSGPFPTSIAPWLLCHGRIPHFGSPTFWTFRILLSLFPCTNWPTLYRVGRGVGPSRPLGHSRPFALLSGSIVLCPIPLEVVSKDPRNNSSLELVLSCRRNSERNLTKKVSVSNSVENKQLFYAIDKVYYILISFLTMNCKLTYLIFVFFVVLIFFLSFFRRQIAGSLSRGWFLWVWESEHSLLPPGRDVHVSGTPTRPPHPPLLFSLVLGPRLTAR